MIYNILLTILLVLKTAIVPLHKPILEVTHFWQTNQVVARIAGANTIASPTPTPIPVENIDPMVNLINRERQAVNLPAVTENSQLDQSAKAKACDMLNNNYFDHKDKQGKDAWHLFTEAGYDYRRAGENLARYYPNDVQAMAGFMASPKHKENVLGKDYKEVGIGRCGQFIVQHYGSK